MRSPHCKSSRQAAFTLVELMVTAVVLVLVLTVASINYLRFLEKQRLYSDGAAIESLLKDARNKAQTGFLGSQELGFCERLQAIEVTSRVNLNNQLVFSAGVRCANDDFTVYDEYIVEQVGATLSQTMSAAFLPGGGVNLLLDGNQVDELSAMIRQGQTVVVIHINGSGLISVLSATPTPTALPTHVVPTDEPLPTGTFEPTISPTGGVPGPTGNPEM